MMGLPDMTVLYGGPPESKVRGTNGLWSSPCGQHPDTPSALTAGTNLDYHVTDVADESWPAYAMRKQEEAILVYDLNCSAPDAVLHSPFMEKKVIGVRLNGSLVDKRGRGAFVDVADWDR